MRSSRGAVCCKLACLARARTILSRQSVICVCSTRWPGSVIVTVAVALILRHFERFCAHAFVFVSLLLAEATASPASATLTLGSKATALPASFLTGIGWLA